MWRNLRWAATALAAGAALVLTATPAPAQAASHWRIERVFGRSNYLILQAIAASGAKNAWLLGLVPNPEPTFVTQRWNGSRWVHVVLPARLRAVIGPWELDSGMYTTSPRDTWFFPVLPDRMTPVQYALRWNGLAWTTSEVTARPDTVVDAAVFSSRDVWAFGVAPSSRSSYGPAVVRHWNGTAWSAPPLPTFPPVKSGYPWVAAAITAAGPRDAWVAETPAASQQTGFSPAGLILLHWNGSTWRMVAKNRKLRDVTGLTRDGHGGFWLTATDPANPSASDIIDYRNGTFTSQPARRGRAMPAPSAASSRFPAPAPRGRRGCWFRSRPAPPKPISFATLRKRRTVQPIGPSSTGVPVPPAVTALAEPAPAQSGRRAGQPGCGRLSGCRPGPGPARIPAGPPTEDARWLVSSSKPCLSSWAALTWAP